MKKQINIYLLLFFTGINIVKAQNDTILKDDAEKITYLWEYKNQYPIGPIRLSSSYPALLEGRLIAKAPGAADWVVIHLSSMDEAGTTYPGFSRMLYLTAGTILEFGLTADTATTLVSIGEISDNNELCIVKIN